MPSEVKLLRGTLDLVPLRALEAMGPQGTMYPALARTRALAKDTERWRRLAGFVDALLLNEPQ